ncbi:hypothetical protein [Acholeplasma equifetale]|uniref:hypothetical protein n=1 Tax=Acholeplasma equifetale TaxID=264634 RepID=UPI00047AB80E|nr:hypothetical protein [Acholeplasma equifetale]
MAWCNDTYIIGERIRVEGEKDYGVVTRIDYERRLVFVLFKRMKETAYPYPYSLESGLLVPLVTKKS